jgi:MFS family permease
VHRTPVSAVVRRHWREILLTALVRTGQQVPFYVFSNYVLTYGTQVLKLPRGTILNYVLAMSLVSMAAIPFWGALSDVVGLRRLTAVGCAVMVVWPFAYFSLLDSGRLALVFLAIVAAQPIHDIQYGPQAALIAESFPGSLRYSGASLGYQLASITAGGPAPLIALWLYERFHTSIAVAAYLSLSAVVSLVALRLLPPPPSARE